MADSLVISATDNDRLCSCCKFVLSVRTENIYYPHHQSETALGKSAADCPLCFIIWLAYGAKKYDQGAGIGMKFVAFKFSLLDGSRELDMLKGRSARHIKYHFRAVFSNRPPPRVADYDSVRVGSQETALIHIIAVPVKAEDGSILRVSSSNTSSKETWSTITRWLHQCVFSHHGCRGNGISGWMPTRVIDVGTLRSPHLHLYITSSDSHISPYAAVSHCWGGIQNVKQLREANIDSMVHDINLNDLPWTFRDAITVTRRIGLQYLWIDSLCIIQDSLEDWTRESSKMGEIYKNCLVNISATAAPNGDSGCFFPRNSAEARTCRVVIERAASGKIRAKSRLFDLVPKDMWYDSLHKEPLAARGWVVQEQFLAPRIIHFSRSQVFWECHQLNACEMFPNGIPSTMRGGWRKSLLPNDQRNRLMLNLAKVETGPISNSTIDAHAAWITTIRLYTRCHLTEERDKLIAVSAIAREIQPIIQDVYLAGLWRRYLPFQLLWFAHYPPASDRIPTRSKNYCAPSWSWASLNANVDEGLHTLKEGKDFMIKVLEAKVETTSSDMFGQVIAGYLRIRGWMRGFYVGNRTRFPWSLDVPGGGLVTALFDEPQNSGSGLWYCLPIMEGLDWRNNMKITGLVLERAEESNIYRRAGIFYASGRYPGDKRFEDFRRPSYSSQLAKSKEKEGKKLGTSRNKRIKSSIDAEADGIIAMTQSPVFKWDAGGKNPRFGHASTEKHTQEDTNSTDWFFFPDSLPKEGRALTNFTSQIITHAGEGSSRPLARHQDGAEDGDYNYNQSQLLDERNSRITDVFISASISKSYLGGGILGAKSDDDTTSKKRRREEDEADDILLNGSTRPDPGSDDSSEEFSDSSDEDTDEEAMGELTAEEQEVKMKEEWVECIITII